MPSADKLKGITITRSSPVRRTPRVQQVEGMFDLKATKNSEVTWNVSLDLPVEWNVGLIVGPSGSGKTTVARRFFSEAICDGFDWPKDKSILDGFPAMSIKEIVLLLSSVGFSSPPSWLRPFHVLSNGEQFRVTMARALAQKEGVCVMDEFTSVVDRTVAKIGSAAIAKTVRRRGQRFVAVSCHYDIVEWLSPDWVYQPHRNRLTLPRGSLQRPPIALEIRRVHHSAWDLFRKHHYLSETFNKAARAFVAFVDGTPAAFQSVIVTPHQIRKNLYRGHRAVCLPDFQGVGIGNKLIETVASAYRGLGMGILSTTTHPALCNYRARSPLWLCKRKPGSLAAPRLSTSRMQGWAPATRLTSTWEYVGPGMAADQARKLVYG